MQWQVGCGVVDRPPGLLLQPGARRQAMSPGGNHKPSVRTGVDGPVTYLHGKTSQDECCRSAGEPAGDGFLLTDCHNLISGDPLYYETESHLNIHTTPRTEKRRAGLKPGWQSSSAGFFTSYLWGQAKTSVHSMIQDIASQGRIARGKTGSTKTDQPFFFCSYFPC